MRIVYDILIVISLFFAFAGVVGLLRMPDTFCRMQSSTNITTLGVMGVILAGFLYAIFGVHDGAMAIKIAIIGIFYIITNPVSSHALCRGAYRHGVRPQKPMETDQYEEDLTEE